MHIQHKCDTEQISHIIYKLNLRLNAVKFDWMQIYLMSTSPTIYNLRKTGIWLPSQVTVRVYSAIILKHFILTYYF